MLDSQPAGHLPAASPGSQAHHMTQQASPSRHAPLIAEPTGPIGAAAPSAAALDKRVLAELRLLDPGGSSGLIPRVYSCYLQSLARLLSQLTLAHQHGDDAAMNLAAHTLKSSSASVGALALSRLCAQVEDALRAGASDQLPGLHERLLAEAACVEAAVPHFLSDQ